MILWIDHFLFGSGYGMKSPYWDERLYWLADTNKKRRHGNGELYTYFGGLGAQLHSFQWFMPAPGERRMLGGREFVVFSVTRKWLRVQVSWAMVHAPAGCAEALQCFRDFEKGLGEIG